VARAQPEAIAVGQDERRIDHRVEVEERLAHPHEDEVREMPSPRGEPASGMADLVHDLRHVEVALEAQLARGAERAADGTAGLAADAERVPLASLAPGRIVA